jgi:hypothetical protein
MSKGSSLWEGSNHTNVWISKMKCYEDSLEAYFKACSLVTLTLSARALRSIRQTREHPLLPVIANREGAAVAAAVGKTERMTEAAARPNTTPTSILRIVILQMDVGVVLGHSFSLTLNMVLVCSYWSSL